MLIADHLSHLPVNTGWKPVPQPRIENGRIQSIRSFVNSSLIREFEFRHS